MGLLVCVHALVTTKHRKMTVAATPQAADGSQTFSVSKQGHTKRSCQVSSKSVNVSRSSRTKMYTDIGALLNLDGLS